MSKKIEDSNNRRVKILLLPGLDAISSVQVKRSIPARFDPFQRILRTGKIGLSGISE